MELHYFTMQTCPLIRLDLWAVAVTVVGLYPHTMRKDPLNSHQSQMEGPVFFFRGHIPQCFQTIRPWQKSQTLIVDCLLLHKVCCKTHDSRNASRCDVTYCTGSSLLPPIVIIMMIKDFIYTAWQYSKKKSFVEKKESNSDSALVFAPPLIVHMCYINTNVLARNKKFQGLSTNTGLSLPLSRSVFFISNCNS